MASRCERTGLAQEPRLDNSFRTACSPADDVINLHAILSKTSRRHHALIDCHRVLQRSRQRTNGIREVLSRFCLANNFTPIVPTQVEPHSISNDVVPRFGPYTCWKCASLLASDEQKHFLKWQFKRITGRKPFLSFAPLETIYLDLWKDRSVSPLFAVSIGTACVYLACIAVTTQICIAQDSIS